MGLLNIKTTYNRKIQEHEITSYTKIRKEQQSRVVSYYLTPNVMLCVCNF